MSGVAIDAPWAAALQGAVERGELTAYYQPQFDLRTERIVAVEALARWTHPEFGSVPPDEFIAVAEETGYVREIGLFMLRTSCRQLATWRAEGFHIEVSVNVSPIELVHPTFARDVLAILEDCGTRPDEVTLEVTETLPIEDGPHLLDGLDEVRAAGMSISIDDFGVGYASVERVQDLRANELKIDKSLIRDGDGVALETAIGHAKEAGIRIVAEGVETAEHLERARALQSDRAQGYLLGRPVPAEQLRLTA
ncbi:MAG TPA: EAL domain-containing protein [Rhodoglobus sp.]|nr:EAL domain-containing protein [Rhodoglobus sp.]